MAINTILGPFSPQTTAPQPNIVGLDPGTNSLIDASVARGQQTPSQFAEQSNAGVSEAPTSALQTKEQGHQQDQSQGYASSSMNDAIRNQYRNQMGQNVGRLENTYSQNAVFQKNAALQQASAEAMARQNVTSQSYSRLMSAYNQTEAARAQVLNSILGAGGAAAGTAAAGRGHKSKGNADNGYGSGQGDIQGADDSPGDSVSGYATP